MKRSSKFNSKKEKKTYFDEKLKENKKNPEKIWKTLRTIGSARQKVTFY